MLSENRPPIFITVLALLTLLLLPNCGGGGANTTSSNSSDSSVRVTVNPSSVGVLQGGTQTFTAGVTGTLNTAVNWSVQEGGTGGSITPAGSYTAPNQAGMFHVIATSQADPTKSAMAVVVVQAVGISLQQPTVNLDVGEQFTFVANVNGSVNTGVSWSIQEGVSGGSISNAGVYTAPGSNGTFHVIARSQADTGKTAVGTVTIAPLVVSVSPTSDMLGPSGVRSFQATLNTSLNQSVTWSVQEGAVGGGVDSNGKYTAPNNTGLFHVVATSVQNPAKSGTASVTIVPSGFRPTANMTQGRSAHTATLLQDGKVLIAGGDGCFYIYYYYGSTCRLSSAEIYNPGTDTFAPSGSMSVARVFHTATLLNNGKVLVAGGLAASAELYDPSSNTFANTASMSVSRTNHTATLLPNGKVLIVGGQNGSGTLSTSELYDHATGIFTATGSMLAARQSHTATLLANGKVLVTGGFGAPGLLATAELYDPATGTFTATNPMATTRVFHTATLLNNGNVLVTGGFGGFGNSTLSSAEVYDAAIGIFGPTGAMLVPRDSHIAVLLPNGTVLATGGIDDYTADLYNPGTGTFSQTGSMSVVRRFAAAVRLLDGRMFICGGSDSDSSEVYE